MANVIEISFAYSGAYRAESARTSLMNYSLLGKLVSDSTEKMLGMDQYAGNQKNEI